jgi:hypothetical protein
MKIKKNLRAQKTGLILIFILIFCSVPAAVFAQ